MRTTPAGIDFTSNDYLGYGRQRQYYQELLENAGPELPGGTSGLASRLLGGNHPIW